MKLFLLFFTSVLGVFTSVDNFKPIYTGRAQEVAIDLKGRVYIFDKEGNLSKYDTSSAGNKEISYAQYGNNAWIDVSNQLELFVFFPSVFKVLILDNQLNLQKEIDLSGEMDMNISGFGRSADGSLWIFDKNRERLINYSHTGNRIQESMQISGFGDAKRIKIKDFGNKIVLFNTSKMMELDRNLSVIKSEELSNGYIITVTAKGHYLEKNKELFYSQNSAIHLDTMLRNLPDTIRIFDVNAHQVLGANDNAVFLRPVLQEIK